MAPAATMRQAAVAEKEEDVEFDDYDQDDEDAMEEDGRAARALPVPQIVSPALVRTRALRRPQQLGPRLQPRQLRLPPRLWRSGTGPAAMWEPRTPHTAIFCRDLLTSNFGWVFGLNRMLNFD